MNKIYTTILMIVMLFSISISVNAQMKVAPADVAAALLVKVVAYERNISKTAQEISIYVLGDENVAMELQKGIGKSVGQATVRTIKSGIQLPESKPNILFIADDKMVQEALAYSKTNKVLSVTGSPDLVLKGVALGLAIGENGKPKILVNLDSSKKEGLDWNASIFKVAKTI